MKMYVVWKLPLFWYYHLLAHSNNFCWFTHVSDIDKDPDYISPSCLSSLLHYSWWSNHIGRPAVFPKGPHSLFWNCEHIVPFQETCRVPLASPWTHWWALRAQLHFRSLFPRKLSITNPRLSKCFFFATLCTL